jgi:hypothetical protein
MTRSKPRKLPPRLAAAKIQLRMRSWQNYVFLEEH